LVVGEPVARCYLYGNDRGLQPGNPNVTDLLTFDGKPTT
jgi:hypothetical protein